MTGADVGRTVSVGWGQHGHGGKMGTVLSVLGSGGDARVLVGLADWERSVAWFWPWELHLQ